MNRRQLIKLMGAASAAVAAPLPSLASAQAAQKGSYIWAVAAAKAQNRVSPQILMQQLKVSEPVAKGLYTKLMQRGVITAPNAAGISQAVTPLFRGAAQIPGAATGFVKAAQKTQPKMSDILRKAGSHLKDATQEALEDQDLSLDDGSEPPAVSDAARSAE